MKVPRVSPRVWVVLILVGLVGLELGLQRAGFGRTPVMEVDSQLGWRLIPNQRVRSRSGALIEINGDGFRDRRWAAPNEPEVSVVDGGQRGLRVALLGDSVAYGPGLPREEGMAHWLESTLLARVPEGALVQNFATSGWSLQQMADCYRFVAACWKPDIVVLVMGTGSIRPPLPVPVGSDYPLRRTIQRTATWDYLRREVWVDADQSGLQSEDEQRARRLVERLPLSAAVKPLWTAAGQQLGALVREVQEDGGRFCLVLVPRMSELYGPDWDGPEGAEQQLGQRWRRLLRPNDHALTIDTRRALRRSLLPLLEAAEAAGLGVAQVWGRRRVPRSKGLVDPGATPFLLKDPLHLAPKGHRIVAAEILIGLEKAGWVPVTGGSGVR